MKLSYRTVILLCCIFAIFNLGISIPQDAKEIAKEENKTNKKENVRTDTVVETKDIDSYKLPEVNESTCIAEVIKIISDKTEKLPGGNKQRSQELLIKIISGKEKNKVRITSNIIPDNPAFSIVGEIGKKYLVTKIESIEDGKEDYFLIDYERQNYIFILIGIFLLLLILVGGFKGFMAIISLVVTISFIAFFLIPSLEFGINPLLSCVIVCSLSACICLFFVGGFSLKTLASILSTVIGVSVSGLIATYVIKTAPLSGLSSNEAMILWGNQLYNINFKGLLACGMIISCLGAVMDMSISIASAIQEIKIANPNYTFLQMFNSGMNVGRDVIGTMTNTLILAYTGMALPLLILIKYENNPSKFLNLELIVSEVTATISGSVGIVLAVPLAALIMSFLLSKKKKSISKLPLEDSVEIKC